MNRPLFIPHLRGCLASLVGGGKWRVLLWVGGLFAGNLLAAAEKLTPAPGTKEITNGQLFWELSSAEKERPHQLNYEMIVFYYDPHWHLLWGACAGAGSYLPVKGAPFALSTGQRVRLEGVVVPAEGLLPEQVRVIELGRNELPKPKLVHGRLPEIPPIDTYWAQLEGYVFGQQLIDPNHVEFLVLTDDWLARVRLLVSEKDPIPQLLHARVRCTGVLAKEPNLPPKHVDFWVPRPTDIEVLGELESDARFAMSRTPLGELLGHAANDWVKIDGAVKEFVAGARLVLRDETGQLSLETQQPGDLHVGDKIEVIGRVRGHGLETTLGEVVYRRLKEKTAPTDPSVPKPARRILRIIETVMELSPDEAEIGQQVMLQGLVTWSNPEEDRFYLQDTTGGICVRRSAGMDAPRLHEWVVVDGYTGLGDFAPEVRASHWTPRPGQVQPTAPLVSLDEAVTGGSEAKRIAMRGYVRQVVHEGPWSRLGLTAGSGEFEAVLPRDETLTELAGAMVRVTGVCAAVANQRRQLVGLKLWVTGKASLLVETPPPADPFAVDASTVAGLNQFTRAGMLHRRVVVRGRVQLHAPGRYFVLQDGESGLLVYSNQTAPLEIGSSLAVSGLPGREGNRLVLREAVARISPQAATSVSPFVSERLLIPVLEWDARLVSMRGVLRGVVENNGAFRLTMEAGPVQFDALVQADPEWRPPETGSFLKLTGVYLLEFDENRQPRAFHLELRDSRDVELVEAPAWLTVGRAVGIATSLGCLILLGIVWVTLLRRRIQAQTLQIRQQMEREARMQQELERATRLDSLGLLAGGIAHDFNNLLTAIRGNLGLIQLEQEAMAIVGHLVKDAERAAKRATDVTQQLLTFAKGGDPVRAVVDLTEIVREAATFARHGSNVRVDLFFANELPPAEVDAGQISRVVHNLVLNAVQCLKNGGEVRVGLSVRDLHDREAGSLPAGRYLLLTVADNGPGIPPDRLARIFDPYYTSKEKGSGLGLATCHSIVSKHKGHIDVVSSATSGTIFHIWLRAATPTHTHVRLDTSSPIASNGAHILFMDDDEGVLKLARAYIERVGHDGVLVSDGQDAIDVFRQARASGKVFDVVIFDLTVPGGMGGKEALEQIKLIDPQVRAIASSGYSNDPIMSNHTAYGFSDVLPKPYDLDSFVRVIDRVRLRKS